MWGYGARCLSSGLDPRAQRQHYATACGKLPTDRHSFVDCQKTLSWLSSSLFFSTRLCICRHSLASSDAGERGYHLNESGRWRSRQSVCWHRDASLIYLLRSAMPLCFNKTFRLVQRLVHSKGSCTRAWMHCLLPYGPCTPCKTTTNKPARSIITWNTDCIGKTNRQPVDRRVADRCRLNRCQVGSAVCMFPRLCHSEIHAYTLHGAREQVRTTP